MVNSGTIELLIHENSIFLAPVKYRLVYHVSALAAQHTIVCPADFYLFFGLLGLKHVINFAWPNWESSVAPPRDHSDIRY